MRVGQIGDAFDPAKRFLASGLLRGCRPGERLVEPLEVVPQTVPRFDVRFAEEQTPNQSPGPCPQVDHGGIGRDSRHIMALELQHVEQEHAVGRGDLEQCDWGRWLAKRLPLAIDTNNDVTACLVGEQMGFRMVQRGTVVDHKHLTQRWWWQAARKRAVSDERASACGRPPP